ncbi:MAG: shikimate dehydrogenase [Deferribacteraceae bacterium]|jgi:shikimate dehydrogenase|nr:shikimate dehydrogenase [Deferribacteraceae bacterium]
MSLEVQTAPHKAIICLLAYPAKHSLSPLIHNTAFERCGLPYFYTIFETPPQSIQNAVLGIRALGIKGASVSMPHKQSVMQYLDELSASVLLVGAVNTINAVDGKLIGFNTDGAGFIGALKDRGINIDGAKLVIAGSGGAGRGIIAQAALSGVKQIAVFNRKSQNYAETLQLISRLEKLSSAELTLYDIEDKTSFYDEISSADIFANATSVGMKEDRSIVEDFSIFHKELTVFDSVYNPIETALLKGAKSAGCMTVNGVEMLLHQGAEQFSIWTGAPFPLEFVKPLLFPEEGHKEHEKSVYLKPPYNHSKP